MNDWKKLEKDNLPTDILTGDYEFRLITQLANTNINTDGADTMYFLRLASHDHDVFYRKKQNPVPTHEQIMTKWWEDRWPYAWVKVVRYEPDKDYRYYILDGHAVKQVSKKWFIDKKSADIPPEEL